MEKFTVEYVFHKASPAILWKCISTPDGLSGWFADQVDNNGKIYSFTWEGNTQMARLLRRVDEELMQFRWEDEADDTYFEIAVTRTELTDDTVLKITDFADDGETEDAILLWNTQIDKLRRIAGL